MNKELLIGFLEHISETQGEKADTATADFQQGLSMGSMMTAETLLNFIRAGRFDKEEE